ncbi:flagellar motor protein MotB [Advenella sp. WQ 585]|uniref:Flagellar motor protein MotB n=1 Tax=Advenella mandrilli TaxID=2800330 RepID=A0ABS1EEE4_9BURK|nr:flagellar motor protein MotB [Advenella mandrilli]MBK1781528.1 flagellar motor protein MotB [Advenella mandrilli]
MSGNAPRIVIRKKRTSHEEGHSSGSWKIAYADFMTAMMAFFLVMWILSLVPKSELKDLADYFRRPLISAVTGDPYVPASRNVIPGGGTPSPIPTKSALQEITSLIPQVSRSEQSEDSERLENLKRNVDLQIENNPTLKNFKPQMVMDMTPEGLRIQILDNQQQPMFATGSAQLNPEMIYILKELAPLLNDMPNGISIGGHTDATQYVTGEHAYSNWELSADRANSARQALVNNGLSESKIRRILGLSSTINLVKDDPYSPINRRISIVVLNHKAEQVLEKMNASPGLKQEDLDARLQHAKDRHETPSVSSLSSVHPPLSSSINSATLAQVPKAQSDSSARQVFIPLPGMVSVVNKVLADPVVAGQADSEQADSEKAVQLVQGLGDSGYDIEKIMPSPSIGKQENILWQTADTVVGSLLGTATAAIPPSSGAGQVSTTSLVSQNKNRNLIEPVKKIENPAVNVSRRVENSPATDVTGKDPVFVKKANPAKTAEPVKKVAPAKKAEPVRKTASGKKPASTTKASPAKSASSEMSVAAEKKGIVAKQGVPPPKASTVSSVSKSGSGSNSGMAKTGPSTRAVDTEIDLRSILLNNFYQ